MLSFVSRLRAGTNVNKRHAPVWQAWGVLETRYGTVEDARDIFQQGIWACAQLAGSQSGGYECARLWQAWGVLEAREGNFLAARRCFSRALDADNRNVAATTAWALMEEGLGNLNDARSIFERALVQFPTGSDEKMSLWRAYELMEQRTNNPKAAQQVYQRSMREAMSSLQEEEIQDYESELRAKKEPEIDEVLRKSEEVEVVRWVGDTTTNNMRGEVWMNNGSIEGKVPAATLQKANKRLKPEE
jgi:tetratricopeptide (TPR) repeat protein